MGEDGDAAATSGQSISFEDDGDGDGDGDGRLVHEHFEGERTRYQISASQQSCRSYR